MVPRSPSSPGSPKQSFRHPRPTWSATGRTRVSNVNLNWQVNPPAGTSPPTLTINTRPEGDTAAYGSYFGEYSNTYGGTGGPRVVQLAVKLYF
jgi:hypothetical protein